MDMGKGVKMDAPDEYEVPLIDEELSASTSDIDVLFHVQPGIGRCPENTVAGVNINFDKSCEARPFEDLWLESTCARKSEVNMAESHGT
jgi:hypothetical protein